MSFPWRQRPSFASIKKQLQNKTIDLHFNIFQSYIFSILNGEVKHSELNGSKPVCSYFLHESNFGSLLPLSNILNLLHSGMIYYLSSHYDFVLYSGDEM